MSRNDAAFPGLCGCFQKLHIAGHMDQVRLRSYFLQLRALLT